MGAESMLSGAPARHEFKRVQKTGDNPPQFEPHLMKPAGVSRNPLISASSYAAAQDARVAELVAMHQHTHAEKLCTSRVYERGVSQRVPRPVAEEKTNYRSLDITLIGARGLRNADSVKVKGEGLSDPYCTCEIVGKPHSRIKTRLVKDSLDPIWDYQGEIQDFEDGDSLTFCVWDFDQGDDDDLLGKVTLNSSQFYPAGYDGEVPLEDVGGNSRPFLRIHIPDVHQKALDLVSHGGLRPEDDFTERCVRQFISGVRRLGSRGLPRISQAFHDVSVSDGTLDEAGFTKVALAEGFCRDLSASSRVFRHFKLAGCGKVRVDAIMTAARGLLQGARLRIVRDVWNKLDPDGRGFIEVSTLMAKFDARRLPAAMNDGVSLETLRREFLEGLGVSSRTIMTRDQTFSLEEAEARRRPVPNGHPGGGPIMAPAGKPGENSFFPRERGDFIQELKSRHPVAHPGAQVTVQKFEEYYAALSTGMLDERIFEKTVRDPWEAQQVHEDAMLPRIDIYAKKKKNPIKPQFRVIATFKDGSQRVVLFSNVDGMSDAFGHGGVNCNQVWSWGQSKPEFQAELIRRLEDEGVRDVSYARVVPA